MAGDGGVSVLQRWLDENCTSLKSPLTARRRNGPVNGNGGSAKNLPGRRLVGAPDAYSGFKGTGLAAQLRKRAPAAVIGGLATHHRVPDTVKDALTNGFRVVMLPAPIRAVDISAGDSQSAIRDIRDMIACCAEPAQLSG
ncbi:isochorismatase family protein [Massilia atriviolacea]|uniref:Isochorismatase family protein n=1 Tax=Massilia atriviolacea TaxID=2495579 RepID=A0A430HU64_9BURK|nr:isochorismatase family protein [Massilia atriviolacea]